MNKIAIVTDSSLIINEKIKQKYNNIKIIPLVMILNNTSEILEEDKILDNDFYKILSKQNIKTSQASIGLIEQKWDEFLKKYKFLLIVGISKGLSSAHSNLINLASKEKFKNKVLVIDTYGLFVILEEILLRLEEFIEKNKIKKITDFDPIINSINKLRKDYTFLLFPKSLETLKKGGRIARSVSLISNILKIYPILIFKEGKIEKYGIMKNYWKGIVKQAKILKNNFKTEEIIISYSRFDDKSIPKKIINSLKDINFKSIIFIEMPKIIISHLGPNSFGISVWKNNALSNSSKNWRKDK